MSQKTLNRAARWIVWALRHEPAKAGIALDEQGWVDVAELLKATPKVIVAGALNGGDGLTTRPATLKRADLDQIVAADSKQRLEVSANGLKIRAAQGHSFAVDLSALAAHPPAFLFHGTASHFLNAIRIEGLRPGARHQVHLSADIETALQVGQRHGAPVVLPVDAERLHAAGVGFVRASNGVWLCSSVPSAFIQWSGLVWPEAPAESPIHPRIN